MGRLVTHRLSLSGVVGLWLSLLLLLPSLLMLLLLIAGWVGRLEGESVSRTCFSSVKETLDAPTEHFGDAGVVSGLVGRLDSHPRDKSSKHVTRACEPTAGWSGAGAMETARGGRRIISVSTSPGPAVARMACFIARLSTCAGVTGRTAPGIGGCGIIAPLFVSAASSWRGT